MPEPDFLTTKLIAEYFVLVLVATTGVIQVAAAYVNLRGVLFLKRRIPSGVLGGLAILGSFLWFFISDNRNQRGLEGTQQFSFFLLGCFVAIVFTLVISSLINWRMKPPGDETAAPKEGLNALEDMSYFEALKRSYKRWQERRKHS